MCFNELDDLDGEGLVVGDVEVAVVCFGVVEHDELWCSATVVEHGGQRQGMGDWAIRERCKLRERTCLVLRNRSVWHKREGGPGPSRQIRTGISSRSHREICSHRPFKHVNRDPQIARLSLSSFRERLTAGGLFPSSQQQPVHIALPSQLLIKISFPQ